MGPIYDALGNPVTSESLKKAYEMGMLAKKDLIHGQMYRGVCRNASEAVWHAPTERFVHVREKFGYYFLESIGHPEDDDGFDFFVPEEAIEGRLPEKELREWYRLNDRQAARLKWRALHPELDTITKINEYFNNNYKQRDEIIESTPLEVEERYVQFY